MSLNDILKASAIKKENEKLLSLINEMGAGEAIIVKTKIDEYKLILDELATKTETLNTRVAELSGEITKKKSEIIVLDEEILLESFALYKPKFAFQASEIYREKLEICREKQKQLIKNGSAVTANEGWTVNGSKSEGNKMVNDMKKLLVRSFNNECDYCVDNVKFNNMEVNEKRIEKSFDALNKLGRIMNARITEPYKMLKYEELYIAFEYQQKKTRRKRGTKTGT